MIIEFLISLWATFFVIRISAHLFHDMKNYGTKKDKSRTFTGWLRKKTKKDIHHIHLGMIVVGLVVISTIFWEINVISLSFLGVGISLIADQIFPLINLGNYFGKKMLAASFILHILITIIAIKII